MDKYLNITVFIDAWSKSDISNDATSHSITDNTPTFIRICDKWCETIISHIKILTTREMKDVLNTSIPIQDILIVSKFIADFLNLIDTVQRNKAVDKTGIGIPVNWFKQYIISTEFISKCIEILYEIELTIEQKSNILLFYDVKSLLNRIVDYDTYNKSTEAYESICKICILNNKYTHMLIGISCIDIELHKKNNTLERVLTECRTSHKCDSSIRLRLYNSIMSSSHELKTIAHYVIYFISSVSHALKFIDDELFNIQQYLKANSNIHYELE